VAYVEASVFSPSASSSDVLRYRLDDDQIAKVKSALADIAAEPNNEGVAADSEPSLRDEVAMLKQTIYEVGRDAVLLAEANLTADQQKWNRLSDKVDTISKRLDSHDAANMMIKELHTNYKELQKLTSTLQTDLSGLQLKHDALQKQHARLLRQLSGIGSEQQGCVVCMEAAINCILQPCAHACICQSCAEKLTACPVCRSAIQQTGPVYLQA
jgi:chromosome segregation ATPase